MTANKFNNWLDTFNEEKNIDAEQILDVVSQDGTPHFIPVGVVIEHIKITSPAEQAEIKSIIVKIDFANGDVVHFYKHLAGAIANNYSGAFA